MNTNKNRRSVKFLDNIAGSSPRYPDSLVQEITENFKNLNIPIRYETKRRIPRIAKS